RTRDAGRQSGARHRLADRGLVGRRRLLSREPAAGGRDGARTPGASACDRGRCVVELSAPLFGDLSLSITDRAPSADTHDGRYPAARLQRGLLLVCPGRDLAEEGVGFGVPILKRGAQTVFPGAME